MFKLTKKKIAKLVEYERIMCYHIKWLKLTHTVDFVILQ